MSQGKPKVYSAEFKQSAVKLTNESGKPICATLIDLGVKKNPSTPGSTNIAAQ